MKRPAVFKQQDVTRAIRAAQAAGLSAARVEIDPNGKIVIVYEGAVSTMQHDVLDKELTEFEAKNGRD